MADTLVTDATVRSFMVDWTAPRMTDMLALKYPFLVDIQKSVGRDFYTNQGGSAHTIFEPIRTRIPQGHADIDRGGDFGDAQPSAGERASFELMIQTLKIMLDERILDQAGAQPKMVLNYLGDEMLKGMKSFSLRMDGMLHHGANGVMATTTGDYAAGPPKTFEVDNYGILADMLGMKLDVNDKVSGATNHADGIVLTGIDRPSSLVQYTGDGLGGAGDGVGIVAGDAVMLENPKLTVNKPVCQFGVNDVMGRTDIALVDTDGTYDFGGIDRTADGEHWKGNILDADTSNLKFDIIQRAVDEVSDRSSEAIDRLYMKENLRRAFMAHYYHVFPGHTLPTKTLSPGYKIIEYEAGDKTLGIAVDKKIPSGEFWGVKLNTLKIRHAKPIGWRTRNGGPIYASQTAYRCLAFIIYIWQLTCNNPGANIRVHNLTVPA